MEIMTEL
jgi:hypothetical protein